MDVHEALAMGRALMARHGLEGWSLGLDRAKTRAGACRFGRRQITISRHLTALHGAPEVRDTLLHEIAHALAGPAHGHDALWRATARSIGCTAMRCLPVGSPVVPGPWEGTCPAGHVHHRHRRPDRPVSCARCRRTFDLRHLLTWTHHGARVRMPASYDAQLSVLRSGGTATTTSTGASPAPTGAGAPLGGLRVGARVRVTAPGRYLGVEGRVEKCGRTRYHVRIPSGLLTVPFALAAPLVEPVADPSG